MGFFSKFFSLGGRRHTKSNTKKGKNDELEGWRYQAEKGGQAASGQASRDSGKEFRNKDPEAAASRLLRSSSAHFNVVAEMDFAALPPIRE